MTLDRTTRRESELGLCGEANDGVLTINSPRLQAAIGFIFGKGITLGDFRPGLRGTKGGEPSSAISPCSLDPARRRRSRSR